MLIVYQTLDLIHLIVIRCSDHLNQTDLLLLQLVITIELRVFLWFGLLRQFVLCVAAHFLYKRALLAPGCGHCCTTLVVTVALLGIVLVPIGFHCLML